MKVRCSLCVSMIWNMIHVRLRIRLMCTVQQQQHVYQKDSTQSTWYPNNSANDMTVHGKETNTTPKGIVNQGMEFGWSWQIVNCRGGIFKVLPILLEYSSHMQRIIHSFTVIANDSFICSDPSTCLRSFLISSSPATNVRFNYTRTHK